MKLLRIMIRGLSYFKERRGNFYKYGIKIPLKGGSRMKKTFILLAVVMLVGLGTYAFAHGPGSGGGYGPGMGGGHMGYGPGPGAGYGCSGGAYKGGHMGSGYGGGMMGGMMGGGHMGGYGGHMGPGYGDGDGYRESKAEKKYLDETAGLRREFNEKRFEYDEAVRNGDKDKAEKLAKELDEINDKIYSKAPKTGYRGRGGYGGHRW